LESSKLLLKNTLIYTVGTFGTKVLVFALLPIFSFYLTKSDLGIYDLVMTTVSLLVPFVTLQVSNGAYRWLLGFDEIEGIKVNKIITSSFIVISGGLFLFVVVCILFSLFYDFKYSFYLMLLVLTSSFLPYFQILLRGLKKTKLFAISGLLNAFLLVILNLIFLLVYDLGIKGLFIATIASNILTIIFILFKGSFIKNLKLSYFSKITSKEMLSFSIPLVPNAISWWLVNSADKYLILYFLTSEMNGVFAISSRFPTIIILVNSIFILAWQDHTIMSKENDEERLKFDSKIFKMFINFEFSIVFILIAVSELTVRFLIATEFYESYKFMPLLYIGAAFSAFSGYFGAAFIREKKTKEIFTSSVICGVINLIVCLLLIKYIGLFASALGTFVSYLVMFFIRVKQSKSFYKIKLNYIRLLFLTSIALLFSFFILLDIKILTNFMIVSSILISILLNRNFLKIINQKFFVNKYLNGR
jgi:O-antigen/teichoic acid export membrane protein